VIGGGLLASDYGPSLNELSENFLSDFAQSFVNFVACFLVSEE